MIEKIKGLILSGHKENKDIAIQLIRSQKLTKADLNGFLVDTLNNEVYFLDKEDSIHFEYSMQYDWEREPYIKMLVKTEKKINSLGRFYLDYIIDGKIIYEEAFFIRGDSRMVEEDYQIKEISKLEFKKII